MRRLVVALLALAGSGGALAVDGDAEHYYGCRYRPGFDSEQEVRLATVKAGAAGRTHFFRDDDKSCPVDRAACRRKAFVVPGDVVLVDRVVQGWACAWFAGAKGSTMGWIDASELAFSAPEPYPPLAAWLGEWERVAPAGVEEGSASVEFSKVGDGIGVVGSALWIGAPFEDGNRMVNTGDLGDFDEDFNSIPAFVRVEGATAVLQGDDEDACSATFRRLGAWLIVEDNMRCGGLNVSFAGTYRRVDGKSGGSR